MMCFVLTFLSSKEILIHFELCIVLHNKRGKQNILFPPIVKVAICYIKYTFLSSKMQEKKHIKSNNFIKDFSFSINYLGWSLSG
jgi:hypothetical protein